MVELGALKLPGAQFSDQKINQTTGTTEPHVKVAAVNAGFHPNYSQARKYQKTSIYADSFGVKAQNQEAHCQVMSGNQAQCVDYSNNIGGQFSMHHPDIAWLNNGVVQNSNDFTFSLNAIKHDHPFMSNYDHVSETMEPAASDLMLGSAPAPSPDSPLMSHQWQANEVEKSAGSSAPYCMPYGYCYEDGTHLAQGQPKLKSEFADILPLTLEDEWVINNKFFGCEPEVNYCNPQLWPNVEYAEKPIKVEDAFQLDKDLKSGPTLAELNSTADIWDAIDLDELLASSQSEKHKPSFKKPCNQIDLPCANMVSVTPAQPAVEEDPKLQENIDYLASVLSLPSKQNLTVSSPSIQYDSSRPPCPSSATGVVDEKPKIENTVLSNILNTPAAASGKQCKLPEIKEEKLESSPCPAAFTSTPSAPTPTQTPTPAPVLAPVPVPMAVTVSGSNITPNTRKRNNSISTDCSFSSHDEGFDSDLENSSDDESFYGDYDAKDLLGASTSDDASNKWALNMGRSRKSGQQRYFWQYNVQSKGPKGTRMASVEDSTTDPHVLCEASDPVFSPDCHIEGVKHAGKARRGDGNDLTPNPKKLLMIGLELKKLSRIINDLTPVAEVPITARNKSRKEKNKLASRACRLKKKAQHEANKIKLYGLQEEHKKMMAILVDIRKLVQQVVHKKCTSKQSFSTMFEELVAQKGPPVGVAGKTTEFVNTVLDNVALGASNGGLEMV